MATGRAILAIDQGTTSSRAIVFDSDGKTIATAQEPLPLSYPHSGWVNVDAEQLWHVTLGVARTAIEESGISASDFAGIGIANQRETTIVWDRKTGEPVAPGIVWQSRQSSALIEALIARGMGETYQRVTGLVPDAYFSASKIAWLLENVSGLRDRAEAGDVLFGTVDSWLIWKLTGGRTHATDIANASRTMVFDIHEGQWSQRLLDDLSIPRSMLPRVVGNAEIIAETDPEVFGAAIPIAGSAGDQQAALFGQTCFRPGEAKNTYGTGSFLLMNTGEKAVRSARKLLSTVAWEMDGRRTYALEGGVFVSGAAVQWLRDGLGIIQHSGDIEPLAASVPDSGGVVFVPALTGLGAPDWDPDARGTIVGLTRGTTAAHIARSTLEAIALQTRDLIDAMEADSGIHLSELRVDGGAVRNDLLMQIQADVLGVPVVRPKMIETTALGAAYLAGIATGVWGSMDEIRTHWGVDRRFEPAIGARERDRMHERWRNAVERSKGWSR